MNFINFHTRCINIAGVFFISIKRVLQENSLAAKPIREEIVKEGYG